MSHEPAGLDDWYSVMPGERRALAKAITLIESTRPEHRREADALLTAVLPVLQRRRALRLA